jgi:molybdopterin/thiamine biosynthesis adenylyltransferase
VIVTSCGRLCLHRKRINLSVTLADQAVGIKEVDHGIWLVSFMDYDLGYIDLEEKTLEPPRKSLRAKSVAVGLIGSGSVGGLVGGAMARTGFEDMMLMDFDFIEIHNLDRLSYATRADIERLKVDVQAAYLAARATADPFRVETIPAAVFEEAGFRAALDCDVLIACVDRPWGRYVMNLIAYAHLIPVIDGGIAVRCNKHGKLAAADWRAHTDTVGRPCLQCLRQYDPGLVQAEREGLLDDPNYISGLSNDHPLKMRENVFAFSMSCASMQVLQMLALALDPLGQPNPGAQLYHFVGNITEPPSFQNCHPECQFPSIVAMGDDCGIPALGVRRLPPEVPGDASCIVQPAKV